VTTTDHRVLLVDPIDTTLAVLASRLRMQGYAVTECSTAAEGARHALSDPPRAVVADLWMPGISGV
jgi:DNA-binding response OmpR family regulator